MADIYIIYASEDKEAARILCDHLSEQWDVWWDDNLVGDHRRKIPPEIKNAKCIVPLYSVKSLVKDTVIGEIGLARKYNKEVVPVRLDDTSPPYDFPDWSGVTLQGWLGEIECPGLRQLKRKITTIVNPKKKPRRPKFIANNKIPLPSVFLSVSSFNTKLVTQDAVKILRLCKVPSILVSAYDLIPRDILHDGYDYDPSPMLKELKKYKKKGGFILLDSGNYEATRFKDKDWNVSQLKRVLENTPHDWAFCFDNLKPSLGHKVSVNDIVETVKRGQEFTSATVLPVIHAPELNKGGFKLNFIPQIIREVSEELTPPLIAIPERELGAGIISRAKKVKEIREELNKLPYYQPLHLLGAGHPCAIAVLAAAGADTFDGLEWCRYMIDTDRENINHFDLYDLFGSEANPDIGFAANVALQNLEYFKAFGKVMHDMSSHEKIELFVHGVINNKQAFIRLKDDFSELFK